MLILFVVVAICQAQQELPQRYHFTRSNRNRQRDPSAEPNAKKLKVTDKEEDEFEPQNEQTDVGGICLLQCLACVILSS